VLIEPTSALPPPTRSGRWRLLLAVVAPAVLLAGVIGAGTLAVDGAADGAATGPSASPRAAGPLPSPGPPSSVGSRPPGSVDLAASFPARVQGLPTRTVSDLLERRRDGSLDDALQAVIGYLTVQPGTFDCFWGDETGATLPMVQAVGCRREVVLGETADPVLGWAGGEVIWLARPGPAHLHAPVFHGISLGSFEPLVSARAPTSASTGGGLEPVPIRPEPVLLIGRFGDPRVADPPTNSDHRNETFTLERLVRSVDGLEERPAIQLITPPSGSAPIEVLRAAVAAESPGSVILSHAFLELRQLDDLDAVASDAARNALAGPGVTTDERSGVWYVRVMVRDGQPVAALAGDRLPRRLGWVVLRADGTVLGSALDG
jgi:hypothetical protein